MSNSSRIDDDSAEAKRAEDAVWHLRTIVESSCDAILSNDFAGTILSWNLAAERMFGYAAEEAVGKSIAVLLPPGEVPGVLERLQQGKPVDHYDTTVTTKTGALLDVSLGVSPILNASGKLLGACTTIRDITELKRTEESLARLAKVFMDSADPILIEDTSGCVIDMNFEAELAYGYTRSELLGKPIKTIIPVRQHEQADELLRQCLQQGEVRSVEGFRQNKPGKVFPVLLSLSLLTDRHGKPAGIATICKNITDLKRTERALRKAVDRLTCVNGELEDFVAIASHDLHAPLRRISQFGEILSKECEGQLPKTLKEYVGFMVQGAEDMTRLLDALLEYSRVGRSGESFEAVNLNAVMQQVLTNLEYDIHECQARVEVAELPHIHGDATGLLQLLQNLVANAIKFCGDQVPVVSVSAERDGDMWRMSVKDNGIGVDPKHHDKIFAAFKRLYGESRYEGSGIGLATCKKIVEQHDGRIWVESEPTKGATFHFTLPVLQEE